MWLQGIRGNLGPWPSAAGRWLRHDRESKVMGEPEFREAERAHGSLLAPLEKRCLVWLAERMPPWVNSDHLTLLGFIAMVGVGLCYWTARRHPMALLVGAFFLAVNWFGDSLDGTLARVRNRQRPQYGFYVDHVVDTFSALFLTSGLAFSGYMSTAIAAGLRLMIFIMFQQVIFGTHTNFVSDQLCLCSVTP